MRDIKFRAWDKEKKEMIPADSLAFEQYEPLIYQLNAPGAELMQYTGLKDKNGKEIYEGDIVTFEDAACDAEGYHDNVFLNRGVVAYDSESMSFFFTNRQTVDMDDIYIPNDVEVIGNIYENPELIGE